MVVGPQSESYRALRYLVQRLPDVLAYGEMLDRMAEVLGLPPELAVAA
jgi:hypothetical protein